MSNSLWFYELQLPGSSVPGIFQESKLEWVAIYFSRDRTCVSSISCTARQALYHQCHLGSPIYQYTNDMISLKQKKSGQSDYLIFLVF